MADLTTLAAAKDYLKITTASADALLSRLISQVSAAVENYLQGPVLLQDVTEVRDGTGATALLLAQYPVASVTSLVIDGQPIPQAESWGAAGWMLSDRKVLLWGYRFTRGHANVRVVYRAGWATTPADIELAVLETVALTYRRADHVDLSSKALAGETVSFITAEFTPSARTVLNSYRRVAPL